MSMPKIKKKRPVKITLMTLVCLLLIYWTFSMFFKTHFYLGTVINDVNVSGKTAKETDVALTRLAAAYALELDERGGVKEQIKGSEIGLQLNAKDGSRSLKNKQNRISGFMPLFNHKALHIGNALTYNADMLKTRCAKLSCVGSAETTESKNATLVYSEDGYEIVQERYGNKADYDILYSNIRDAVMNGKTKLDLDDTKCYKDPTVTADSQKVKDTKTMLEKYLTSEITYTYAGGSEVVDTGEIGNWIELDNDLNVIFNRTKMRRFVNRLASHYNTCGKVRNFTTSQGTKIKVGGGDYGWRVDVKGEMAYLTGAVKNGETAAREPLYSQKGASHAANDIGDTYVEANLTMQHLWYYKDGALVVGGDVVSGNVNNGNGTPAGIYSVKYKDKYAVLAGDDYSVDVDYWMPFNNNIGIHDAKWRSDFGGNLYLTKGSHGCINCPYSLAENIFNNIFAGTPVVCYY